MDRETRRVNFTKLQVPAETKQRITRSSSTSVAPISNFFSTTIENNVDSNSKQKKTSSKNKDPIPVPEVQINSACKTTKLSTFISNNGTEVSPVLSKLKKPRESDFFDKSQPKVKKAPKLTSISNTAKRSTRKGRTKGQPNIKSAFLRNEEIFSEITAQHCRADNFNPDEIELALALSKSEVDSCPGQESEQAVDTNKEESVRKKLQKYGFRTAAKEDYNTFSTAFLPGVRRGKREKWANKFTALTLRNPEVQEKKLNAKVQAFLEEQEKFKSMNVVESLMVEPYQLSTKSLKHLQIDAENLVFTRQNERDTKDLSSFYVTELFEISKVPAGHLLKNWAKIEGRDLSPVRINERTKQRLERFKEVYDDLEEYFDTKNEDKENLKKQEYKENDILKMDQEVQVNELDELIHLINNNKDEPKLEKQQSVVVNSTSSSPLKEPPDKRCKLNLDVTNIQEASGTISSFEIPITQATRSGSPDLFADSEDDEDACITNTETVNKSLDDALHNFSLQIHQMHDNNKTMHNNGEEKSSSNNFQLIVEPAEEDQKLSPNYPIIDLTQENSKENEQIIFGRDTPILLDNSFDFKFSSVMNESETEKDNDNSINFILSNEIMPSSTDKNESSLLNDIENESNLFSFQHEEQLNTECHKQNATGIKNNKMHDDEGVDDTFLNDLSENYNIRVPSNNRKTKSFTKLTPVKLQKIRRTCSFAEPKTNESFDLESDFVIPTSTTSFNKSKSFSSSNAIVTESTNSIDLTQDESSSASDDDCILLSDDEINYSIWKADQTFGTKEQDFVEEQENDSSSLLNEFDQMPQYIDSPLKSKLPNILSPSRLNFDLDNEDKDDNDELKAYLLSSQTQSDKSRSPNKSALSRERAEFGIMDAALSEPPFTYSPEREEEENFNWAELSFADSPCKMTKLKRYSSNNNKFNDFLSDFGIKSKEQEGGDNDIQKDDDNDDDEIDEFDKIVFQALETKEQKDTKSNVPSGLDQLLTGELSFNVAQEIKTTSPTKLSAAHSKLVPDKELNVPEKVTVNGSVYKVRICTSPKPDFQMMPESEILKQLYNYGIKPLKRTQAVKMLEFIYDQTHSIMLAAEEPRTAAAPPSTQVHSTWSKSKSTSSIASTDASSKISHRLPLTQIKSAIFSKPDGDDDVDDQTDELISNAKDTSSDKLELHDAYGDQLLRYAHDLQPDLVADDEWYVLQTNVTKKTPRPLIPLHIAWHNLLCANPKLHESVIMFEPIDLHEIYLFLKKLGCRYDPKDLKTFFDRRCIIFRYDLTAPGKQVTRHIRKPKRTKSNIKRS